MIEMLQKDDFCTLNNETCNIILIYINYILFTFAKF